jgi:phage/plasmid-like protein (TIGR03299 family)
MAHQLTITSRGTAEMAFVGATPWHGLGQILLPEASIEEWRVAAGMDWDIKRTNVQYTNGELHDWKDNDVLYRSDTNTPLAIVSPRYKEVQPKQVLEFFRSLVEQNGFTLETAGTLKGGRRFWALARTGFDGEVVDGDNINTYLLLVTSCDGGLATTAQFTSVRVVCNNTLQMSLNTSCGTRVSVRHNTEFNPNSFKAELGLNAVEVYTDFMDRMKGFANTSLSGARAEEIIEAMFAKKGVTVPIRATKGFKTVLQLFNGVGKGSQIDGVAGTAWGLVNAVTEYSDFHIRAKNQEYRLDSAWFGAGRALKENILELVAEV